MSSLSVLKASHRDQLFCAHGFYEEIICCNFRCNALYFLLWTIWGFFFMWQLYRKWKLIIPAVAAWEVVLTSCRPTAPPHNIKQGQSCSEALWGQEPLPGHSSWDPFASQSPLNNSPFSPPRVQVTQHIHRYYHLAKSMCLRWWQSVPYFSCVKVHICPHTQPRCSRWAVCSHSPKHAMCFWSRAVMGHVSSLTPDPTHTLTVPTRLQICPSSFMSYVHFSRERSISGHVMAKALQGHSESDRAR